MTQKSLKVSGWSRDADRSGTPVCILSPVPLRWHTWASQEHSHPSTNNLHLMPSLGREEQLGLDAETSWEEMGTRWGCIKNFLNYKDNCSDGDYTDRPPTPRVHFSQAKQRKGEAGIRSPTPSLVTTFQVCPEGRKGARWWASLDPDCRSWDASKVSLRRGWGSVKIPNV